MKHLFEYFSKVPFVFLYDHCFGRLIERTLLNSKNVMAKAYLDIELTIEGIDRAGVTAVYNLYKDPFLESVKGAISNELLVHVEDVRIFHGFESLEDAQLYLLSKFFNTDFITSLKPYIIDNPNVRIYEVA